MYFLGSLTHAENKMKTYMNYTDTEAEKRALESRKRKAVPKRNFNEMISLKRPRKTENNLALENKENNIINNHNYDEDTDELMNDSVKEVPQRNYNEMIMLMKQPRKPDKTNLTSEKKERNAVNHISDEETEDILNNSSTSDNASYNLENSSAQVNSKSDPLYKIKNRSLMDKENVIENVNVHYSSFVDDLEQSQLSNRSDPLFQDNELASGFSTPPNDGSNNSFDSNVQSPSSTEKERSVHEKSFENILSKQNSSLFLDSVQLMMNSTVEKICSRIEKKIDEGLSKLTDNFTELVQQMKRLDKKLEDEPVNIIKDNEFKVPVPITSPEKLTLFNSKLGNTVFREQMVRIMINVEL